MKVNDQPQTVELGHDVFISYYTDRQITFYMYLYRISLQYTLE